MVTREKNDIAITPTLPPSLYAALRRRAEQEGESMAAIVRRALRLYLYGD